MLCACLLPRAPQSRSETLVPPMCPAGKEPPPHPPLPPHPLAALLQMGLV